MGTGVRKLTSEQKEEIAQRYIATLEENDSRPPVICICGRDFVSTVVGCILCHDEMAESLRVELENPNFIVDRS